jgi:phosphate transport system substrate-binding protein
MRLSLRLRTVLLAALVAITGGIGGLPQAFAATLKAGGTGAVTELLNQLAPAFKAETGIDLEVIAGLGTSGANNAVADGKLGLAVSGRALRDKEKTRGLKVVTSFRSPFGLVTSRPGPDSLKSIELAALYRSDGPLWPDGMPILITLRPADESDNIVLGDYFTGMREALLHLRKRRDLSIAATDQDNAEMAEKAKGSLTSATLVQIMAEKRNLRFVDIDGVAPSVENVLSSAYPYTKPLYLVAPSEPSPEAEAFLAFLARPAGVALLRRAGVIPGSDGAPK